MTAKNLNYMKRPKIKRTKFKYYKWQLLEDEKE